MSEVLDRVAVLDSFVLEDNQPNIEGPSPTVLLDTNSHFNYADRNAFDTTWNDETVVMAKLVYYLWRGGKIQIATTASMVFFCRLFVVVVVSK